MPFKGMWHGNGVADGAVATIVTARISIMTSRGLNTYCDVAQRISIMTSRGLNTYCDVAQYMNGLWIFITKTWIAQGPFINIIRSLSKQWGVCDNVHDYPF